MSINNLEAKYDLAIAEIRRFFVAEGLNQENLKILYGVRAAEHHGSFDADCCAILITWTEDEWRSLYEFAATTDMPFSTNIEQKEHIWSRMITFLSTNGIKTKGGYDYLNELAVVLLLDDEEFGGECESSEKSNKRLIKLPTAIAKTLKKDFSQAKKYAGKQVRQICNDQGSFNFDHVRLVLPNYRESEIKSICEEVGLTCSKKGNHLHPEFQFGSKYDQMKNTIFCDKLTEYLKCRKYDANVNYILD